MKKFIYILFLLFLGCQSALDTITENDSQYNTINNENNNTVNNNTNTNINVNNNTNSTGILTYKNIKLLDVNFKKNSNLISDSQNLTYSNSVRNMFESVVEKVNSRIGINETQYINFELSIEDMSAANGGGVNGGNLGLTDLQYGYVGNTISSIKTTIYIDMQDVVDNFKHIYGDTSIQDILNHEMAHAMFLVSNIKRKIASQYFNNYPTWLHEGMAVYTENGFDAYLKEAKYSGNITVKGIVNLTQDDYSAYFEGAATFEYIKTKYSEQKIKDFVNYLINNDTNVATAIINVFGITLTTLSNRVKIFCTNAISNYRGSIRSSEKNDVKLLKRLL